jgi:hypothetical protein
MRFWIVSLLLLILCGCTRKVRQAVDSENVLHAELKSALTSVEIAFAVNGDARSLEEVFKWIQEREPRLLITTGTGRDVQVKINPDIGLWKKTKLPRNEDPQLIACYVPATIDDRESGGKVYFAITFEHELIKLKAVPSWEVPK